MKKSKILLSLTAGIASASLVAPVVTLVTSCSENPFLPTFALIRTSKGYCIDSLVSSNRSEITNLVVPEYIDDIPVVEISKGAFKGCTNLKSITLPFIGHTKSAVGQAGLFGYIFGDEMYEGCGAYTWQWFTDNDEYGVIPEDYAPFAIPNSLRSVTITSATNIASGAFSNCKYLKNITVKTSSSNAITEIGNFAFYNCIALKEFAIPTTVKTIGKNCFDWCYSLKSITIPSSVTTIKHSAFANCKSAMNAYIPSSVVNMGKLVFENFDSGLIMVEAETIPSTWDSQWVTHDISVVYGYTSGGIYYTDKAQVAICGKEGQKYAFIISWLGDWNVETLTIPGTISCGGVEYKVKKIGPNVFESNTVVKKVNISENIETLGTSCFANCSSLETINFPSTLTTIGLNCFTGCNNLHMHTDENTGEDVEGLFFNKVKTIEASAFEGNTSLISIDLGDSIETIGDSAFKNCTWLTPSRDGTGAQRPLLFPKTIKSIGANAFYNIAKFRTDSDSKNADIVFEEGNTNEVTIGQSAFENASVRSTTTDYPNQIIMFVNFNNINITKFEDNTFKNVYIYGLYNFPESVEEIGNYAFYYTTPVYLDTAHTNRKFTIPASVKKIGNYAFYNCYNCAFEIEGAETNESDLEVIGKHAFRYCSYNDSSDYTKGFYKMVIPNSVTTIGEYAFQGASALRTVTLPTNSLFTRLESNTFNGCTNLGVDQTDAQPNPIIVPESVTYIGSSAFSSCKNLKYATIAGPITTLGGSCFAGCESLENGKETSNGNLQSLVFSDEFKHLTSFGSNVYQGCKKMVWAPFPLAGQSTITSIPSTCFADCEKLSNFNVLGNITSIGNAAFRNCKTMTAVTGMEAVKYIYQNAFYGCTGLTSFAMPDGCHTIGDNAFANCTSLSELTLPTDIIQEWTTESNKGMGKTPFIGWTDDQTIYFRDANIESVDSTTKVITTRWGWKLKPDNTTSPTYYTCDASGSTGAHAVHFVKI